LPVSILHPRTFHASRADETASASFVSQSVDPTYPDTHSSLSPGSSEKSRHSPSLPCDCSRKSLALLIARSSEFTLHVITLASSYCTIMVGTSVTGAAITRPRPPSGYRFQVRDPHLSFRSNVLRND